MSKCKHDSGCWADNRRRSSSSAGTRCGYEARDTEEPVETKEKFDSYVTELELTLSDINRYKIIVQQANLGIDSSLDSLSSKIRDMIRFIKECTSEKFYFGHPSFAKRGERNWGFFDNWPNSHNVRDGVVTEITGRIMKPKTRQVSRRKHNVGIVHDSSRDNRQVLSSSVEGGMRSAGLLGKDSPSSISTTNSTEERINGLMGRIREEVGSFRASLDQRGSISSGNEEGKLNGLQLTVVPGRVEEQDTEAIVNAANNSLVYGGGVCGAIYRSAGITSLSEYMERNYKNGISTGESVISPGFELKAKHIIHTVGPDLRVLDRESGCSLLRKAYLSALYTCEDNGIKSVSFPSISTGIFCFPLDLATSIAIDTIHSEKDNLRVLQEVRLVAIDEPTWKAYLNAIRGKGYETEDSMGEAQGSGAETSR